MQRKQKRGTGNKLMGGYYFKTLFLVGISFLLIWGCEGGSKPAKPTVVSKHKRQKPPPKEKDERVVEEKEEPSYTYNPVGKRDPFIPFITLGPKKPVSTVPLTPLQRYDVSELKLVGILKGPAGYRALVEDAGGKGFIITKGTPIGRGNGRVKEIHDNRVIIEQTYKDIFGQIKQREISIPLRKPEEGG
ncbi:MAG: pilus assembly protein PilP [Syntrophobacterales bacterium]|nr:MAG: pilus assembly protein PilP [Syntrophobacterales bacterium]